MKTYNKIVTAGCSFTYGYGLEDPSKQSWPAVLAERLGCDLTNLAVPGAGNTYIANSIIDNHVVDPDCDLVVIGWSFFSRMDLCHHNGKIMHLSHNSRNNKDLVAMLYGNYMHLPYAYKKYLNTVLLMQGWLESKKIDYMMFDAISGNHDSVFLEDDLTRGLTKNIDRQRFIGFGVKNLDNMTDPAHRLPDGHPDHRAHARMAEILHDFLLNMKKDPT